jgi:hypothetical protein
MQPLPRLAVIVLNWNGREQLADLLPGLLACDHPDYFVLVVDNASQDGSVEWISREYPGLEVLRMAENLRFSGGNNAGARRAIERGARQLLILNNDTRVDPHCLRRLAETFEADERIGIVGPRICYDHEPCRIWYGGGVLWRALGFTMHRALRASVDAGRDPTGPTAWVSGCALAVRRETWEQLGGLDDGFYIYCEDVDFCLRAREAGWRIHYEPRALVLHKVSASVGGGSSAFKSYHKARSGVQLFVRHTGGPLRASALLGRLLHDLAAAGLLTGRGQRSAARAVGRAWWDLLRGARRYEVGDRLPS